MDDEWKKGPSFERIGLMPGATKERERERGREREGNIKQVIDLLWTCDCDKRNR